MVHKDCLNFLDLLVQKKKGLISCICCHLDSNSEADFVWVELRFGVSSDFYGVAAADLAMRCADS